MNINEDVKILCVDDEKNVLRALERLFLDSDYEIMTAMSGDEGLEILEDNETIQLVISDYRMPRMNGVDFLKEVYKLRPDTVRIVLSGYADTATIVDAINEGQIYKFIPKPWNDDELKVTIANALDHYFVNQRNILLTRELETKNTELQEINNNLERLVEERTADLMVRNRILTSSQNILDSLPVGVIGVDQNGLIVQCNKKGMALFETGGGNIMGMFRDEVLSDEMNAFVDRVLERGEYSGSCKAPDGVRIKARGVYMNYDGGQEGVVLVCEKEKAKISS